MISNSSRDRRMVLVPRSNICAASEPQHLDHPDRSEPTQELSNPAGVPKALASEGLDTSRLLATCLTHGCPALLPGMPFEFPTEDLVHAQTEPTLPGFVEAVKEAQVNGDKQPISLGRPQRHFSTTSHASTVSTVLSEVFSFASHNSTSSWKDYAPDLTRIKRRCKAMLKRPVPNEPNLTSSGTNSRKRATLFRVLPSRARERLENLFRPGPQDRRRSCDPSTESAHPNIPSAKLPQSSRLQDECKEYHTALGTAFVDHSLVASPSFSLMNAYHSPVPSSSASSISCIGSVGGSSTLPDPSPPEHRAMLDSMLSSRRRAIIDRVMTAFEEMCGFGEDVSEDGYESWCSENGSSFSSEIGGSQASKAGEYQEHATGSEARSSSYSDDVDLDKHGWNGKRISSSAFSPPAGKRRRTTGSQESDDEEGNGDDRRRSPQVSKIPLWEQPGSKLACPYFKRDPRRVPKYVSCRYPGFSNVSRLKEHLYRGHVLPILCPRCHQRFETSSGLTDHLMETERCTAAENLLESTMGLNQEQVAKLKKKTRAKAGTTEEEKWRRVFQIVFPDVAENDIPSPYTETETVSIDRRSQDSGDFHRYEQLSRRELPALVRRALEEEIENETNGTEERLLSRLPEIVRMCQEHLFAIFHGREAGSHVIAGNNGRPELDEDATTEVRTSVRSVVPDTNSVERMFVGPPESEVNDAYIAPAPGSHAAPTRKEKRRASEAADSGYDSVGNASFGRQQSSDQSFERPALTQSATVSHSPLLDVGEGPSGYNETQGPDIMLLDDISWQEFLQEDASGYNFSMHGGVSLQPDNYPQCPKNDVS